MSEKVWILLSWIVTLGKRRKCPGEGSVLELSTPRRAGRGRSCSIRFPVHVCAAHWNGFVCSCHPYADRQPIKVRVHLSQYFWSWKKILPSSFSKDLDYILMPGPKHFPLEEQENKSVLQYQAPSAAQPRSPHLTTTQGPMPWYFFISILETLNPLRNDSKIYLGSWHFSVHRLHNYACR